MKPVTLVLLFVVCLLLVVFPACAQAAPDLTIYNMLLEDGDDEAYCGETIQVFVSTKNVGTSDIPPFPAIQNGIYLSTDSTITTGDVELLIYDLPGLSAGGSNNVWKDVVIPADTDPGPYYVGAIADYNDTVAESNEGNNTGSLPISIVLAPDPVLSAPKNGNCYFPGTVSFEWSPVAGASSYQIQVATDSGFSSPVIDDSTSGTTYSGGSLTTTGDYWVRVKANNSNWSTVVAFYVVTQAGPMLSSPANDATITSRRPTLSWGGLPHVRFYHLQVDNDAGFGSPEYEVQTASTEWTSPSDLALRKWYWRVRAFYNEDPDTIIGNFGDEWSFTIGENQPHELTVTAYADSTTIASGGQVGLSASASDSRAHGIAEWSWSDNGAGGTFSPTALTPNPTWTAPGNDTGAPVSRTLTVTVTCDGYPPATASDSIAVVENPREPGAPDLLVTDLAVTPPPDPPSGELPQFSVTVMNNGLSAAGPFTVDIYPDLDSAPDPGTRGEGKIAFDSLAAGTTQTKNCRLVVGGGLRSAWAVVDAGGDVGEADETNNCYGPVHYELSAVPRVATAFWDFGLTGVAGGSLDLLSLKFASVGGSALEIGAEVDLGVIEADAAAAEVGMRGMVALDYRFDNPWSNDDQAAVVTVLSLADLAELGAYSAPVVRSSCRSDHLWNHRMGSAAVRFRLSS